MGHLAQPKVADEELEVRRGGVTQPVCAGPTDPLQVPRPAVATCFCRAGCLCLHQCHCSPCAALMSLWSLAVDTPILQVRRTKAESLRHAMTRWQNGDETPGLPKGGPAVMPSRAARAEEGGNEGVEPAGREDGIGGAGRVSASLGWCCGHAGLGDSAC